MTNRQHDKRMDKLIRTIFPLNPMDDGSCRTIKSQYQQTSTANFIRHTGGYAATGVIEYDTDGRHCEDDTCRML